MELFSVTCSTCQARIKVRKAEAIGEILACPRCQSMVQITPPPDWQAPRMAEKAFVDKPEDNAAAAERSEHSADESGPSSTSQRRFVAFASLPLVVIGTLLATWFLRGRAGESADSTLPAAAIAQAPGEEAAPPPEVAKQPPATDGPARLPQRWIPGDARVVISIDPRSLAARPDLLAELSQAKTMWRDALLPLETAFRLPPERIARITWAADKLNDWHTGGVVIVELAESLADDAALLAGCEKLDLRLDEAICHRRTHGGWKLPFAVVDDRTLVSGSLESLAALSAHREPLERPAMQAALRDLDLRRPFAAAADMAALRNQERGVIQLLDEWAGNEANWPAVRDVPAAASISLSLAGELQAEIVLACSLEQDASQVKEALTELLIAATRGVSAQSEALAKLVAESGPTPEASRRGSLLSEAAAALDARLLETDGDRLLLKSRWLGRPDRVLAGALAMLPPPNPPATDVAVPTAPPPTAVETPEVPATPVESPKPASSVSRPAVDVAARLKDPVKAVDFQKLPLNQFVALLSQLSTIPIELDAGSLGEAGVALDVPVTVALADTNVAKILDAALGPLMLKHEVEAGKLLIRKR